MRNFKSLAPPRTSRIDAAPCWKGCLGLALLLLLTGCARLQVKMGMKVPLAQIPVASMDASLPKGPGIAPGGKSPLVVTVTGRSDAVYATEGAGHGKIMWQDLKVTATVVSVDKKGIVTLAHDPRKSDGQVPHINVTAPSHPSVHAELDVPLRYDSKFVANFSGASGSSGMNGTDGTSGFSGSPGSTDPNNPSPGGDGSDGTDGSNGGDGGDGGNAPAVQVQVALRAGSHPLLQVSVSPSVGHKKLFLIDPQGGSLTVVANGGEGGSGGLRRQRGSRRIGRIRISQWKRRDEAVRMGEAARTDRRAGGGSITVTYDPQTKPFLTVIHLSNTYGPPPVFVEEKVGPLW